MTTSGELHGYAKAMRREMTPCERLLWERLRNRAVIGTKFRRQHPFRKFIFDFYAPELRLVIEVDGSIHGTPDQRAYDAWRDDMAEAEGLIVLRLSNDEVRDDLDRVMSRIELVIIARRNALDSDPSSALTPGPSPTGEGSKTGT